MMGIYRRAGDEKKAILEINDKVVVMTTRDLAKINVMHDPI